MKQGSIVMITTGEYEGKAATVVTSDDTVSTVKIFKTDILVDILDSDLKRRKACVCGQSQIYPFCDGSHANG
jgi:CDGSH-type Zn-finger protein